MTEIEKKAEDYCLNKITSEEVYYHSELSDKVRQAYIDGYEQGQKDFDTDVTKILNSIGITFIDTNSIGGLIGLHGLMLDLEKENEELKKQIEKMKCCSNCKHNQNKLEDNEVCWNCERSCAKFGEEIIKDEWELAE